MNSIEAADSQLETTEVLGYYLSGREIESCGISTSRKTLDVFNPAAGTETLHRWAVLRQGDQRPPSERRVYRHKNLSATLRAQRPRHLLHLRRPIGYLVIQVSNRCTAETDCIHLDTSATNSSFFAELHRAL